MVLSDLVPKRARQRAQDWSRLNVIPERQLDELFAKGNAQESLAKLPSG
jgi:hypothetical protein